MPLTDLPTQPEQEQEQEQGGAARMRTPGAPCLGPSGRLRAPAAEEKREKRGGEGDGAGLFSSFTYFFCFGLFRSPRPESVCSSLSFCSERSH
ncbi:hypothetical protein MHYP_G00189220 [Metynnis hypsauchen]